MATTPIWRAARPATVLLGAVLAVLAGPLTSMAAALNTAPSEDRPAMREILIGNHMPSSKAEMAAYSDELEAVAAGYEAAKTEYIEGQCSGAHAAAIWGTGDTAVADCVAFSVCQDWDQTDDVNDCTALSNFPESHRETKGFASCALCDDDKTQPGCECFETGYDGSTNWRSLPLECGAGDTDDFASGVGPVGSGAASGGASSGDTDDSAAAGSGTGTGANAAVGSGTGSENNADEYGGGGTSYPCRAPITTDRCTMTNRTNPDGSLMDFDSDEAGSPIHGVCQQNYPSALGPSEAGVAYRLFATAPISSGESGVAPFFASGLAVNYHNPCARIIGDGDGLNTPFVECAGVDPNLDDVVMEGMRNEGRMTFELPSNLDRRMALLLNTVQHRSTLTDAAPPLLEVMGGVLACLHTSNSGEVQASAMTKFSVLNLTNYDGASVVASGNVVVNGVTNEAGAGISVAWGRLSIADAVNGGKINVTASSAFLADVDNLAEASILLRAEGVSSDTVFTLENISNHGTVVVNSGVLTGCGVVNAARATISVLGSTIGALHILDNSGALNFTGSTGTVTMVGSANRGTVTGDAGIDWVDGGEDCAVTPPPTQAPIVAISGAPTGGLTRSPTQYNYVGNLDGGWSSSWSTDSGSAPADDGDSVEYQHETCTGFGCGGSPSVISPNGVTPNGPSLTVRFATGDYDQLTRSGKTEVVTRVVNDAVQKSGGSVRDSDMTTVTISKGSVVVRIDFKSNVTYSIAASIAAAIGATPTTITLSVTHTNNGSRPTMVSTAASAEEAKSEDGDSSSGSFGGILIAVIAVLVLAAVVLRRQVQKPKVARKLQSAQVSPAKEGEPDGIIVTSPTRMVALWETTAAPKRVTVQVAAAGPIDRSMSAPAAMFSPDSRNSISSSSSNTSPC